MVSGGVGEDGGRGREDTSEGMVSVNGDGVVERRWCEGSSVEREELEERDQAQRKDCG